MSFRNLYQQMGPLLQADRRQVVADVQRLYPDLEASSSRSIRIAPVRTYVGDTKTLSSNTFPGVVVPAFASHWGVVVGSLLYHLTFREHANAQLATSDFAREGKPIQFSVTLATEDKIMQSQIVGETKYDSEGLIKIGKALIESFGSYHRLFWNCQVFADCFLYLITGGCSFVE